MRRGIIQIGILLAGLLVLTGCETTPPAGPAEPYILVVNSDRSVAKFNLAEEAFLESLSGMAEVADDSFDRFLESEELIERLIRLERAVHEDAAQPRIFGGIDMRRFANRLHHPLGSTGVRCRWCQNQCCGARPHLARRH